MLFGNLKLRCFKIASIIQQMVKFMTKVHQKCFPMGVLLA